MFTNTARMLIVVENNPLVKLIWPPQRILIVVENNPLDKLIFINYFS